MNWAKVRKPDSLYCLYTNRNAFIDDMTALITFGFVDCVVSGAICKTKTLYRLSDRWRFYGTDKFSIPENVKTVSMQGTRKHKDSR